MEEQRKLSIYRRALQLDREEDWQGAHNLVDGATGKVAAHIHAYLHRKEGDDWNARYWYKQADEPFFEGTLAEEWQQLWERYD